MQILGRPRTCVWLGCCDLRTLGLRAGLPKPAVLGWGELSRPPRLQTVAWPAWQQAVRRREPRAGLALRSCGPEQVKCVRSWAQEVSECRSHSGNENLWETP